MGKRTLQPLDLGLYLLQALGAGLADCRDEGVDPLGIGFVAGEAGNEVPPRQGGLAHAQIHDFALKGAHLGQGTAHALQQRIETPRRQLDELERFAQIVEGLVGLRRPPTVLLEGGIGLALELANFVEATRGFDGVWSVVGFFIVVAVTAAVCLVGCRRQGIDRVQVPDHHFGEFGLTSIRTVVGIEHRANNFWVMRHGRHEFANAFLDAFGDHDFTLTGEQLHGTHFSHVHAHGVRGAPGFGFHGRQGCSRFRRGNVVRRSTFTHH